MTVPDRLLLVWNQKDIPVVLRRSGKGERIRARLPYAANNRAWLQAGRRTEPVWNAGEKCWEFPKAWFNDFVRAALGRYGRLYVIQPFREQEVFVPPPAGMPRGMSASVPAWEPTTGPVMTVGGSKCPRPLQPGGGDGILLVA